VPSAPYWLHFDSSHPHPIETEFEMTVYEASTWVIPVIIAITFHEAAHGLVALFFGDDTAWRLGRVSFNPLKHIDPFGTILMPALLLLLRSPFVFGDLRTCPNPRDRRRG
jgi:Zn-dependent protease